MTHELSEYDDLIYEEVDKSVPSFGAMWIGKCTMCNS